MTQKLKNNARSLLVSSILAGDTSLVVESGKADLFPVANTGTDPVGTFGKDWFKAVLQDTAGNVEIIYVRTRAGGNATLSNIQRGQEGTTARDYAAGSVVGLRITSQDVEDAISLASSATATGKAIVGAANQAAAREAIGATSTGQAVMTAADGPAARAAISALSTTEKAASAQYADRILSAPAGGTANAITATFTPNITALTDGLRVRVTGLSENTATNPTLAAGTTAATVIKDYSGAALAVAAIPPEAEFIYSTASAAWILQNTGRTPVWVPAGIVAHFANSTAPAGWLKANGAAVSRTAYAALFAAIGTTYGVGDGATTFNLPDLRGVFLRSLDDGRGIDTGRAIGTMQDQSITDHQHLQAFGPLNGDAGRYGKVATGINATQYSLTAGPNGDANYTSGVQGTTTGSENRPRNVAMLACIKF